MPDVNVMEHIGEDGTFAETFKDQVPAIAGEDFKDSKIFDDVPNLATLIKNYANTKRDYGKKLEGIIQKPGENATDQEKAAYITALRKELGAPDSANDYEIVKPENLPEGMFFNEDAVKAFRELFVSEGISVSTAKLLVEKFNEIQIAHYQSHLEEENKIFEESAKTLKNDWKGDDLVKNARTAHAAIMEFADEDLTTLIKESKIYDTASDLTKWNGLGFSPGQLRLWHNIGSKMKSSEHISDEGGTGGKPPVSERSTPAQIYNHPSSQKARADRAKKE